MSTIKLIKDSCVEQEVDAIVNAANKYLLSGTGVCGTIFQKAGYEELNDECSKIKTPLNDGDAVITSSCNITNCKKIIHAVGPDFSNNKELYINLENLYYAYYDSLQVLKENNLHSISFPLISSGVFGYGLDNPVLESTKSCVRAYKNFTIENNDYDIDVTLCAYTEKEYKEANKEFNLYNFINECSYDPIELTNDLIDNINYDDIIAISIAEPGAMGEPDGFNAIDNKYNLYHINLCDESIDYSKLQNKFTILKNFKCSLEEVTLLEDNWAWFNMGFGNYLMVRKNIENNFRNFIKEYLSIQYESGELYQRWYFILKWIER